MTQRGVTIVVEAAGGAGVVEATGSLAGSGSIEGVGSIEQIAGVYHTGSIEHVTGTTLLQPDWLSSTMHVYINANTGAEQKLFVCSLLAMEAGQVGKVCTSRAIMPSMQMSDQTNAPAEVMLSASATVCVPQLMVARQPVLLWALSARKHVISSSQTN